jgi:hypothetical protein
VLAVSGLIALVLARASLGESRLNETRLLRSRGGSVRRIVVLDARESVIICAVGVLLGTAAAFVVVLLVFGSPPSPLAVALPAAAAFLGSLTVNIVASRRAARGADGAPRESSGRRRAIASGTALIFAGVITAIATWRFLSAVQNGANFAQDPTAVLAPAALLCLSVVIGLIVSTRIAVGAETRLARGPNIDRMLPLRDADRRVPLLVGPAALLALAIATSTIAGSYTTTWSRYLADSQRLTTGAPVRATLSGPTLLEDSSELVDLTAYRSARSVIAAVPVSRETDEFSNTPVTVIGVRASELRRLQPNGSSVVDAGAVAAALDAVAPTGIPLGSGTSVTLAMSATATPDPLLVDPDDVQYDFDGTPLPPPPVSTEPDTVLVTIWLSDPVGSLVPLTLDTIDVSLHGSRASTQQSTALPPGGPWTIVALDALLQAPQAALDFSFRVSGIQVATADGTRKIDLPTQAWTPLNSVFGDGDSNRVADEPLAFSRVQVPPEEADGLDLRLMPPGAARVPVVVSRPFARANGLTVGSGIELDGTWSTFQGVVRKIVDLVPGTTSGDSAIVDLVALNAGRLRASEQLQAVHEVWVGTDDPIVAATGLAAAVPNARFIRAADSEGTDFTGIAVFMLWIGAVGAIGLAWIAIGSAALTMLQRRGSESRVLRALGVRAARQGRWRRAELVGVGIIGLVVGAISGILTTVITVAPLARLAAQSAPLFLTTRLMADPAPIGLAALVLAAGSALIIAIYGRAVVTAVRR